MTKLNNERKTAFGKNFQDIDIVSTDKFDYDFASEWVAYDKSALVAKDSFVPPIPPSSSEEMSKQWTKLVELNREIVKSRVNLKDYKSKVGFSREAINSGR